MNGTGTQADPYQVTTVAEFYEAIAEHNSECPYVKLMNDIDFNDYNYWNLKSTQIDFTEFDGQNHVIKNIYFKDIDKLFYISNSKISRTLKNTIFEVIKFESITPSCFIDFGSNDIESFVVNCEFRAKTFKYMSSAKSLIDVGTYWRFLNCVFNIDYYDAGFTGRIFNMTAAGTSSNYPYMDNCEININLYIYRSSNNIINIFNTARGALFRNNAIFINTYCSLSSDKNVYLFGNGCKVYNTSLVLQNKGKQDLKALNFINSNALQSICIYDKDVLGTTIQNTTDSNLIALTTEQMKDSEYLNSIGFPII